jgi:hypothetical protein
MKIPARPLCPKCGSTHNVHRVIGPQVKEIGNAWNFLTCNHSGSESEGDSEAVDLVCGSGCLSRSSNQTNESDQPDEIDPRHAPRNVASQDLTLTLLLLLPAFFYWEEGVCKNRPPPSLFTV